MKRTLKKIISCFLVSMFLLNVVLPIRETFAMTYPWWYYSQGYDSSGVASPPTGDGGQNDNVGNQQETGEPVFVHNGDFIYEHQDILLPSRGMNTEIARIYKSQSRYNNRFGYGWDIFYNKRIVPLCNGDLFYLNGKLNRYRFVYIDGTNYVSPQGVYDKIVQNLDGTFTLSERHGTVYTFDQNGVLTQIRDRNGNSLHFDYDPAGKLPLIGKSVFSNDPDPKIIAYDYELLKITDTVGREISFNYNSDGRLESIVDFTGRTYSYAYDASGNGDLISYTTPATSEYPSGNTTSYSYTDHNLETITDAKGQTYLTNHYDTDDRVYEQNYGSGTFVFSYDTNNHKTTVTEPKGFVTEWIYDDNGNPISKTEYTSGLRPTDPSAYITVFENNQDLERTSVTYPKGNGVKYTFDTGNLNPQAQGNLLEIRRKADMSASGENIALGKPATASSSYPGSGPEKALDGNLTTMWNAGHFGPAWLKVDLQGTYTIRAITLKNNVAHGETYNIEISDDDITYAEIVPSGLYDDYTHNFIPAVSGRYIRVNFSSGNGDWVHCNELEVTPESQPGGQEIATQFTYEPQFNFVKTITDPKGNITTFTYDYELDPQDPNYGEAGNLVAIVYPEVDQIPQTDFTYNQYGQLETVTDPNGNTTQYVYYDTTGYLKKIIQDPAGLNYTTEFTYDAVGNIASVKDARANTTTFQYNQLNQLTKQIAPSPFNYQTKYFYDQNGNLTQVQRQSGDVMIPWQTTQYSYTILDQLQTITDPLGHATSFTYDANGNRASITDANNNTTTYQYDERNLIWKTIDDLNNTTEYFYDLNGNLAKIKDARANQTIYAYDDFDRLQTTTYADNSYITYAYDDNSNLTSRTTNDNPTTTINYIYDALNRLDLKTYSDLSEVDYVYDLGSRLTSIENQVSTIDYNYDAVNRITQTQTLYSQLATLYSVNYQYDQVGNRKSVNYPSNYSLNYVYDQLNRLTQIKAGSSALVNYSYDPLSRRTRRDIIANKTLRSDYNYDAANRLNFVENKTIGKQGGDKPVQEVPYTQNNFEEDFFNADFYARLSSMGLGFGQVSVSFFGLVNRLRFDTINALRNRSTIRNRNPNHQNELVREEKPQPLNKSFNPFVVTPADAAETLDIKSISSFNYSYDNVGNRLDKVTVRQEELQETYGYDDVYQLTSVTGNQTHSYDYDAVGNREVADGTTYSANNLNQYSVVGAQSYSYDANGNLTSDGTNTYTYDFENRLITASGGGQNASYQYDGFGRRIIKTVDGITTYFIYDGDQVIEERNSNGNLSKRFTYGSGIDELIRYTNHESQTQTYYYFQDGLGSISELLNPNGSVVESYSYDVYGTPSQTSSVGNPYLFTGREYDTETSLYHYRARAYSPAIGRFLQRDPVGYFESMNMYSYVGNNPVNFVDPVGLWTFGSEEGKFMMRLFENIGNEPVRLQWRTGEQLYHIAYNLKWGLHYATQTAHYYWNHIVIQQGGIWVTLAYPLTIKVGLIGVAGYIGWQIGSWISSLPVPNFFGQGTWNVTFGTAFVPSSWEFYPQNEEKKCK